MSKSKQKVKGINYKAIEDKWKKYWEKEGVYNFKGKGSSHSSSRKTPPTIHPKVYSIDTPPPTVSGEMHIGHAFSYAQEDFIVRFMRMYLNGKGEVFYPFGTDDNGLPTERLIERLKKVKSKDMSRADFIKLCLKTLKEITPDFIQDWKDLGVSCDYSKIYSTIDDDSRRISQKSFIDLFKKKEIYEKEFPTIWCPECQTSIAQAELEDKESDSLFSTLKFSCEEKALLIATTRPELLGACVAVFVNPKDKRYKKLIGKKARVPIFDYEVPIIGDSSADVEKGTGVLMVCSYGDKYDVEAINKHKLNPKLILERDGRINLGNYKGMKVKEARRKILEELGCRGLIKDQKKIKHVSNVHDKCGTEIEFIPTSQWFIKVLDKKKQLVSQGKKISWNPKYMYKRYENWVKGLEWDWSISRDRHFGIPIPVWKCPECSDFILPSEKELPIDPLQTKKKCKKCNCNVIPEEKVLDTWATSSLTPEIASNLVGGKIKIPYSLRPQGHDIIRTWAFYTIVKSYLHDKKIPWNDIAISGFVTLGGEKMSKSKGIVIHPKKVMEEFGSDALRFWAASSKLGEDLDYQEKDLVTGKKFVTKLFNASRFVFMNLNDFKGKRPKKLELIDSLFLNDLQILVDSVTKHFLNYEYSKAKMEVEQFFWSNFADNYLEIVKKRVYKGKGNKKASAQYTLYHSLLTLVKLIAPIMPFITEEIYQEYFKKKEKDKSIHVSDWPRTLKKSWGSYDNSFSVFVSILTKVRSEKTKAKKSMNTEIVLTLDESTYKRIEGMLDDLKDVMNAKEIKKGRFSVTFV